MRETLVNVTQDFSLSSSRKIYRCHSVVIHEEMLEGRVFGPCLVPVPPLLPLSFPLPPSLDASAGQPGTVFIIRGGSHDLDLVVDFKHGWLTSRVIT